MKSSADAPVGFAGRVMKYRYKSARWVAFCVLSDTTACFCHRSWPEFLPPLSPPAPCVVIDPFVHSPCLEQALARMNKKSPKMSGGSGWAPKAPAVAAAARPQDLQQKQEQERQEQERQQEQQQQGLTAWKALLCTLIADRELKPLRYDAKRLLRRLCVTQVRCIQWCRPLYGGREGMREFGVPFDCAWLCSCVVAALSVIFFFSVSQTFYVGLCTFS